MNTLTVNLVDSLTAWSKFKKTVNNPMSGDYMAVGDIVQNLRGFNYQLTEKGSGLDNLDQLNLPRFSDVYHLDSEHIFGKVFRNLIPVKHLEDKEVFLVVIITPLSYDRIEVVSYWTR